MIRKLIPLAGCVAAAALLSPASASALNNGDPCGPRYTQDTPPAAAFIWSPDPALTADSITFDGSSSTSGTANKWTYVSADAACDDTSTETDPIHKWTWDFGDGSAPETQVGQATTTHSYAKAGVYTVQLTVTEQNCQQGTNAHCFTNSTTHRVVVNDRPPVAAFSVTGPAVAGQATTFDGSASSDPDGTVANYHWDFGHGHTKNTTSPTTTFKFVTGGPKSVTLTVTDDSGSTGAITHTVDVERRCVVPNVVGLKLAAATTALQNRDCALGLVFHKKAGKKKRGRVLSQSRRPGTVHPVGTTVNVTVGKRKKK